MLKLLQGLIPQRPKWKPDQLFHSCASVPRKLVSTEKQGVVPWVNNKHAYAVLEKLLWQSLKANRSCLSGWDKRYWLLNRKMSEGVSKEEPTVSNKNT